MPLHQNQDGTWQWGKSGKKYKNKEDALKQMKAIFANGYVEKHAALDGTHFSDTNYKGPHMTYTEVYNLIKRAATQLPEESAMHPGNRDTPKFTGSGGQVYPAAYLRRPIGKFKGVAKRKPEYKRPGEKDFAPTTMRDINKVKDNIKRVGEAVGPLDHFPY